MSNSSDWEELIDRHLRGELDESEMERLAELLDSDCSARRDFVEQVQWDTRLAEAMRESRYGRGSLDRAGDDELADERIAKPAVTIRFAKSLLAIAAVTILVLSATLYFQRPGAQPRIATITAMGGSLLWTGDGGRVATDLTVGTQLTGGTVEGMTPDSWVELAFRDGSIVTISGNSMLTFSDHEQKVLRLKEGNLSANVAPQPVGQPMLIHTPAAALEILGTQFKVETGLASTMLNVSEGRVRVKRLSDGSTVDVPAKHRVIAAADREMSPVRLPGSVSRWSSNLHLGPDRTHGKWSPKTEQKESKLRAVPFTFTNRQGKTMTLYTASFGVSRGDQPPVILQPQSHLRVRGHISSPRKLYLGVTVRHANGQFAGNFQATRPAAGFQSEDEFELSIRLTDFRLDPSLVQIKDELPSAPDGLVVESFWCHTLNKPAGLEIAEVELIPPSEDKSERLN